MGSCLGASHTPAHTWRLGYASVLSTSQHPYSAWALALVLGTPCTHVVFELLPLCWAHPFAHMTFGLAICLGARYTPTHTWHLGTLRLDYPLTSHAAKPKIVLGHWLCKAQNKLGCCAHVQDPNSLGSCHHHDCRTCAASRQKSSFHFKN